MIWTEQDLEIISKMKQDSTITWSEIAQFFSERYQEKVTREAVRSVMRRERKKALVPDRSQHQAASFITAYGSPENMYERVPQTTSLRSFNVPSEKPEFAKPTTIAVDGLAILADIHVPYHSNELVNRCLTVMNQLQVYDLCIAGDLTTQDAVQKQYPRTSEVVPFNVEMQRMGDFLIELCERMAENAQMHGYAGKPTLYICSGNHDEKAAKAMDAPLRLQSLVFMGLAGRAPACTIVVTEYDYFDFSINGKEWRVGHLDRYKSRPGEAARLIAETHQKNVAVGHDHMQGFTSTNDGRFLAVSIGAAFEIDENGHSPFWYSMRRNTAFRPMQQGFLVVSLGVPYLFNQFGTSAMSGGLTWEQWDEGFNS